MKLYYSFGLFLMTSCIAMILLYIEQLHSKLKDTNGENVKMLDGMHEGLLILSKDTNQAVFCNKSA